MGMRALIAIAPLLLALGIGNTAAGQPPAEAFAALPAIRDPALSPDGSRFAAIQVTDGRPVVIVRTLDGSGAPPVALPSDDWVIWGLRWLRNDRLAVMAGKGTRSPGGGELWTLNRAVFVSADGSNPVQALRNIKGLANNSNSTTIVDLALNDPEHVYLALFSLNSSTATLDVYGVDVASGKGVKLDDGNRETSGWIMDGEGRVAARIDRTGKPAVERLYVPDGDDWRQLAAASADDGGLRLEGLSDDGQAIVRRTKVAGRLALTRIDIATGKESVMLASDGANIIGAINDEWTGRVIGAVSNEQGGSIHYFDPALQAMQAKLNRSFPGRRVSLVSSDVGRQQLVVAVESPRQPLVYHFIDVASKTATEIDSTYPGLTPDDLGEMKAYDYKARDGLNIPAFITMPPGRAPKNLPAVVMPHGGPDTHDTLGFDWWAQFMANRGYVVLQPNYRGSTGYGEAFNKAGHGEWGLKMQDDITDGVRKMIADGIVDPKRVCIVGASYGGYAALAGATLTPDLYACAVSVAGVSDLPEMIRYERRAHGRRSAVVSFWISRIGSPTDESEKLRATSPARLAANVKCPVLLMHPEMDTTVPIGQSELMADALEAAGKPHSFIRLEGDDHYLQLGSTRLQMLTELEKFLAANIGR